jgi:hypothetical protein
MVDIVNFEEPRFGDRPEASAISGGQPQSPLVPAEVPHVDTPQIQAEVDTLHSTNQQSFTAGDAFKAGFSTLPEQRLMDRFTEPVFPHDDEPPTSQYVVDRYMRSTAESGHIYTPTEQEVLGNSWSKQQLEYRVQQIEQRDKNMRAVQSHFGAGLAGMSSSADLVLMLGTGGASTLARLGRMTKTAEALSMVSDITAGNVETGSRLANMALGGGTGFLYTSLIGALGTAGHADSTDLAVNTLAGALGGALVKGASKETRSSLGVARQEVPELEHAVPVKALDLPGKAEVNSAFHAEPKLDAQLLDPTRRLVDADIQHLDIPAQVDLGIRRTAAMGNPGAALWDRVLGSNDGADFADILGLPELRGAKTYEEAVARLESIGPGVHGTAELPPTTKALIDNLHTTFMPESRIYVTITPKTAAEAGTLTTLKPGVHILAISQETLQNAPKRAQIIAHEFGHVLIHDHLENAPEAVKSALRDAYQQELERPRETSGLGVSDAGRMLERGNVSENQSFIRAFGSAAAGTEHTYWRSFDEFGAQQFVRWMHSSVESGDKSSAVFTALPEPVRRSVSFLLDKWKKLYASLVKFSDLAPSQPFKEWFQSVADDAAKFRNPRNAENTIVNELAASAAKVTPSEHAVEHAADDAAISAGAAETAHVTTLNDLTPIARRGLTPNTDRLNRWGESIFGKGWWSLYDKLQSYGPGVGKLGASLVADGAGNTAASAVHFKRTAALELERRLGSWEAQIQADLGKSKAWQVMHPADYRTLYSNRMRDLYEDIMQKHAAFLKGEPLPVNADSKLEALSQAYAKSGFAETALKYMQTAQRTGADRVERSPWYLPMRTSHDSIINGIRDKRFTEDAVTQLFQAQASKMFPDADPVWAERLGSRLREGIRERAMGRSSDSLHFEGLTRDEVEAALLDIGTPAKETQWLLDRYITGGAQASKDKHLKRRLDWDFALQVPSGTGGTLGMRDVIDQDIPHALQQYGNTVSGLHGLGMVGIYNNQDMRAVIQEAIRDMEQRGASQADMRAARTTLENSVNALVGRRVGERVPDLLRSLTTVSSSLVLRNSAIYNIGELARTVHYAGVMRTAKALLKSGAANGLSAVKEPEKLVRFQDILADRLIAEGRWKPVVTQAEDNFDLSPGIMDGVSMVGQSTRFVNGLEVTRRKISNTLVQIVIADLHDAVKGDSAAATNLAKYGVSADLVHDIGVQVEKFGDHPAKWDSTIEARAYAAMNNVMDQINQANRLGEIPEFMQFSSYGKAIFPFLSFTAAAWNKVLRKTEADGGWQSLAGLALYSMVGGIAIEMGKNALAGRAPGDSGKQNFYTMSAMNTPISSWAGWAQQVSTGSNRNGFMHLAPVSALLRLVQNPDMANAVAAVPLLSVTPGAYGLSKLFSE